MEIYADNAATTKMSGAAIRAMTDCMESAYGNPSSMHGAGRRAAAALKEARSAMAGRLGCSPDEIAFTSGGTEADNQAILSAASLGETLGKRHIVATAMEHPAVLHPLAALMRKGFDVTLLCVHGNGIVTADEVAGAIRSDTCLVSVMFANNEIGTVQPVAEIGAVCRERGVLFHTDAVQAAGRLPIDAERQRIDLLSLSAHKFHGPKGVGLLYARTGVPLVSLIEGGSQERGVRAGTENVPGVVGMAAAFGDACARMEEHAAKTALLRDQLISGLERIPDSYLNGDRVNRLPGNAHFSFDGVDGETLLMLLNREGICASTGSACSAGLLEPSHVLTAIGRSRELARGSLRLTLCHENTEVEVMRIIDAVTNAVGYLRGYGLFDATQ